MVISVFSFNSGAPTWALPPDPLGDFFPQSPSFSPSETNFWLHPWQATDSHLTIDEFLSVRCYATLSKQEIEMGHDP